MFLVDSDLEHVSCHKLMWKNDMEIAYVAIPNWPLEGNFGSL